MILDILDDVKSMLFQEITDFLAKLDSLSWIFSLII